MKTPKFLRNTAVLLVLGLVGGWLISGGLVSIAQTDQVQVPPCPWGDQTFALAAAPTLGGPIAHTFSASSSDRYIWDGRVHHTVALVTVECLSGGFRVDYQEAGGILYGVVLNTIGDSITVASTYMKISGGTGNGRYWVVANLGG